MLRGFNMKFLHKKIYIIIFVFLVSTISMVILYYYMLEYSITGTYSAGYEPDVHNIYLVLYNEKFTIYNRENLLVNGRFEPINQKNNSNVYCLISEDNIEVGHILHDKNKIILLGYEGNDVSLNKISQNPVY